jgi:hypothetical protein
MTRTGRARSGVLLVALLALWVPAAAATPAEPNWNGVDRTAPLPGSAGENNVMPALADLIEPLVLAVVCSVALAFFSARPRQAARARVPRGRWRI